MSRLAPAADPREQLRLAQALGLAPLRLRARGRPAAQARLRITGEQALEQLLQDRLVLALLRSLELTPDDVGGPTAGGGPLIAIGESADPTHLRLPPLPVLRADAAAKRALWPALRRLRRELGGP